MKPLRLSDFADAEVRETTSWYRDRDERVAERFVVEVRRALELIEQFPQIGGRVQGVSDPTVRRMPLHGFPYAIVFVEFVDHVEVAACAHNRRGPAYLLDRLSKL